MTIVFDDMQAPVRVLGTRRWQAPALQSRVRYTGEHSGSASGAGLVYGPFAGAAGRSRDIRSKQETRYDFEPSLMRANLSYMAVSSRSGRS